MESFESEDVNFSKDEIVEGAIYRVELKKIRYDSSFNKSEQDGESRARLRWRLEERKTLKMGTLNKVVESMCLPTGELDTTYLDVLLTTYPSFTTTALLLEAIIKRFEFITQDESTNPQKENCKRSIRHALVLWLAEFGLDFYDPPLFAAMFSVNSFACEHFPSSDLLTAVEQKLDAFLKSNEVPSDPIDYFGNEMVVEVIDKISSTHLPILIPPLDIFIIPSSYFAEQLTYVDANLFCGVVPRHCLGSIWSRRNDKKLLTSSRPVSVLVTIEQFNAVSYRVISTILKWPYAGLSCRTAVVEKWISIAQECRKLKNFSSLKAILAGLQSNPIFRLKKVWHALSREKLDTFKDLAAIFSEDNNQAMWREILYREGTAKNAEVESMSTSSKPINTKAPGSRISLLNNKKSNNTELPLASPGALPSIRGTVPYLGTFLTDLTMLDTAFPDIDPETTMINFEKKRREFEILTQIRILQSTCNLYNILPDPSFLDWFYGIRTYDENESHELSLEIEPSHDTMTKEKVKGHKKNISLGYFTVKKNSLPDDDCVSFDLSSSDRREAQSLKEMPALSKILSTQLDTLSFISTRTTMSDLTHKRTTSNFLNGSDQLQAKVEMVCDQSHTTNFYKSILVSNKDHVSTVMKKILFKFSINANPEDFCLSQRLENNTEIELPDRGNLFYAIKSSNEVRLVVRSKGQVRHKVKSKPRGISALPWNRTKQKANGKMSRLFTSMVSLVPS